MPVQTTTQPAFARSPMRKARQIQALQRAIPSGRPANGLGGLKNMGRAGR